MINPNNKHEIPPNFFGPIPTQTIPPTAAAKAWAKLTGTAEKKDTASSFLKGLLEQHELGAAPGGFAGGVSVFDAVRKQKTLVTMSLESVMKAAQAKTALLTKVAETDLLSENLLKKVDNKANKVLEGLEDRHMMAEYAWLVKAKNSDLTEVERLFKMLLLRRRWNIKVIAKTGSTFSPSAQATLADLTKERGKFQEEMRKDQRENMTKNGEGLGCDLPDISRLAFASDRAALRR